MNKFIYKLLVFLHLKRSGFNRLMYRGTPVVSCNDFPKNKGTLTIKSIRKLYKRAKKYEIQKK